MSRTAARRPSRKAARIAGVGVVAGGLVASAALVWQASYSAFSATTTTPTNNWTAGTVALGDNDNGSALFTVTNLKPGSTGSKCIVVSSTGSLASTVKMYTTAGSFSQTKTLGDNLQLTVTQGTVPAGTTAGLCTGFQADSGVTTTASATNFAGSAVDFGSGFGTWAPAGASTQSPVVKTYKIDYTLNSPSTQAAVDVMQGGTAQIGFTWEAQNS
ncbi:TasA family protein [Jatrophihabitans sp. YIM 134969]